MHPKVVELLKCEQWAQRTPEWYERRKTLITASDCAGAMGIPAFHGQRGDIRAELIKSKCFNVFKGNVFTRHGNDNEDMVRDKAMAVLGMKVLEFGLLVHPELPWLGASPDGVTTCGNLIEIKCPYKRQPIPGEIPFHYMPQGESFEKNDLVHDPCTHTFPLPLQSKFSSKSAIWIYVILWSGSRRTCLIRAPKS